VTTRLRLICHASTAATRASSFPADEPLDPQGWQKLRLVSRDARPADRCLTSPALRARQTAEGLTLKPAIEPMLRDCDYGQWTGCSLDEVLARDPDALAEWTRNPAASPHGGESILRLIERVAAWLDGQKAVPGRVIAVTHASVIRAAVIHAIGAPPTSFFRIDIAPLTVTKLSSHDGRWTLESIAPL
jgi:broad specificity phosphatase PhoE